MIGRIFAVVLALFLAGCMGPAPAVVEVDYGPAEVLPMMLAPHLDGYINPIEWGDALHIRSTFEIHDGSLAAGSYPFDLYIGIDARNLYIAVEIHGAGPNPHNSDQFRYPHDWEMFFTSDSDELSIPSDYISTNHGREYGTSTGDGLWDGTRWKFQGSVDDRGRFNDGRPTDGRWNYYGFTDNSIILEYSIRRDQRDPSVDGLNLDPGNVFRFACRFVIQDPSAEEEIFASDVYPGDGWTPRGHYDPTNWLRFQVPS